MASMGADNIAKKLYYIHVENLPWSACHKDVLEFFEGIAIPTGGVSINGNNAFVAVTNKIDLDKALEMNGKCIHGSTVYLKGSTKRLIFQRKCQNITRKLFQFTPSFRRLRATFVPDTSKDSFKVFKPMETDISDENKEVYLPQPEQRESKKIRPSLLKDLKQLQMSEKSDTDSSGHCFKKRKVYENWLVSHLEV